MAERNRQRAVQLQHYTGERHYHVEYHGFPKSQEASMEVQMTVNAPSSKRFHIISETGSRFSLDHILKKLLESEEEAAKNQNRTALTTTNLCL